MKEAQFFNVDAGLYKQGAKFFVTRPASIIRPKDNSVMFITESYPQYKDVFYSVYNCLIFWPRSWEIPDVIEARNAVVPCNNPHSEYCRFFENNQITNRPSLDDVELVNGAYISRSALIGQDALIFPGVYIGSDVHIGNHCYIGAGVKLLGKVNIGNNVIIRENTVIGADGLTTDRDMGGNALTMPQFGGVLIEDEVQIGANTVIARGAIDDTVICKRSKIDNMVFISHNVFVDQDTFIVGNTLMFGSASVGKRTLISGNCAVGNYVHIGDDVILGVGSIAIKEISSNSVAFGNPAKVIRKNQ